MDAHKMKKTEECWLCEICFQKWKGKPRATCPGVEVYEGVPDTLTTEEELAKLNLKPKNKPVACIKKSGKWIWLYEPSETEIADPHLPTLYTWDNRPKELQTPNQLYRYNRKPGDNRHGCIWSKEGWIYLYKWKECPIDDESLPPYMEYGVKHNLMSTMELKKENLVPGDAKPRGFYRRWEDTQGCWGIVLLYDPKECEWEAPDNYITKSRLKSVYLLSDSWMDRLGDADITRDNPHHDKWHPMLLYSRKRVEKFLADHAEEYANWMDQREKYVANFEANKEGMMKRKEQRRLCLKCASGCATDQGFICAIYPMGLDISQIPCVDFVKRV